MCFLTFHYENLPFHVVFNLNAQNLIFLNVNEIRILCNQPQAAVIQNLADILQKAIGSRLVTFRYRMIKSNRRTLVNRYVLSSYGLDVFRILCVNWQFILAGL